jgi:hypothetical protein
VNRAKGLELAKFRQLSRILNSAERHWIALPISGSIARVASSIPHARALTALSLAQHIVVDAAWNSERP